MALRDIPGQDRVKRFLLQLVLSGRVPHALLFSGMPGVGKKAVALELAKLVNCLEIDSGHQNDSSRLDTCGHCSSCRKLTSGNHPDLVRIVKSGAYIKLAQVQELRGRLRYSPFEAKWRVIIIEDAQNFKEEAGNALLKLLEEPPKRNLFLLLVPEPQMLLPTVVSRCCHLRFQPLAEEWIRGHLIRERHLDADSAADVARLAGGSLSLADQWAEEGRLTRYREVLQRVVSLQGQPMIDFFRMTENWAKEGEDLEQDLECIKFWLRELLHSRIQKSSNALRAEPERLLELESRISAETIFRLHDDLARASLDLHFFANKQLMLEGVLLRIKDLFDGKGYWNSV